MTKIFSVRKHPKSVALSLLFLRILVGVAFILHGWGKIQSPFNWMGPESPVPGFVQFLGALSEFGGGLFLILGLLTFLSSLGILFTMLGAIFMHAVILGDPFVSKGGGSYELAAVYAFISLLFLAAGPGCFALDSKIFGTKK